MISATAANQTIARAEREEGERGECGDVITVATPNVADCQRDEDEPRHRGEDLERFGHAATLAGENIPERLPS
jgi:hypothetical protein